jgi:DNA-directed RNA polymerase specialized sigma24 family protein
MSTHPNNDEIYARAKSGDSHSINELLSRSQSYVAAVAQKQIGSLRAKYELDDVIQDVLFRVMRSLSSCHATDFDAYRGWLVTLTINAMSTKASYFNANKRRDCRGKAVHRDYNADYVEYVSTVELVGRVSERTKSNERAKIAILEDWTYEEMEKRWGCTRSGAYNVIKRYRAELRAAFAED